MKLFALIAVVILSSNAFSQELKDRLPIIVNEYAGQNKADSSWKQISLNSGSVKVPLLCTNRRTGTIDSDRGELMFRNLLINYDIGLMAGTHAAAGNKNTFGWYDEKVVNGHKISIGFKEEGNAWKLVMTIRKNSDNIVREEPANFWANVKNETEIINVIKIVFSYTQNQKI